MHRGLKVRGGAVAIALTALVAAAGSGPAQAARVSQVSPQGEVAEVRQVAVRFDAALVPLGDPRGCLHPSR